MSRAYRYQVTIDLYKDTKHTTPSESLREKLCLACPDLDSFYNWGRNFESCGDLTLGGGTATYEFAEQQSREIFKVLGEPAEIYWSWWFEEREPDDTDSFDEDYYNEWVHPLEQLAAQAEEKE